MKTFLRVLAALCCFLLGMTLVGGAPNAPKTPSVAVELPARRDAPPAPAAEAKTDEEDKEETAEGENGGPAQGEVADAAAQDVSPIDTVPARSPALDSGEPDSGTRDLSPIAEVPSRSPSRDEGEEEDEAAPPQDVAAEDTSPISGVPPRNPALDDGGTNAGTRDLSPAARPPARNPERDDEAGEEDDHNGPEEADSPEEAAEAGTDVDPATQDASPEPPVPEKAPPVSKRRPRMASEPLGPPPPPETWTEAEIAEAKAVCEALINDTKYDFSPMEPIRDGACGAPAPISLAGLKQETAVEFRAVTITCPLADAIDRWVRDVVQPKAKEHLQDQIVGFVNVSGYQCRTRYNAPGQRMSHHAFANAFDISGFRTSTGEQITLLDHWEGAEGKSKFLREIHAGACKIFGTVLGPKANAAHRDHFHFDMAKRRFSSFCE